MCSINVPVYYKCIKAPSKRKELAGIMVVPHTSSAVALMLIVWGGPPASVGCLNSNLAGPSSMSAGCSGASLQPEGDTDRPSKMEDGKLSRDVPSNPQVKTFIAPQGARIIAILLRIRHRSPNESRAPTRFDFFARIAMLHSAHHLEYTSA